MLGYLGPIGTFSYMATKNYSKKTDDELIDYPSIYSLIKAVDENKIDSAIVPIENSIEGSVNSTLDTLAFKTNLYICGEYIMKVSENLIAKKGTKISDIKKIISHPQPIGQCSELINKIFSNAKIEFSESTAAAAKFITENMDNSVAMLGPSACAEIYGLEILMADCGDEKNNATRFVELKKTPNKSFSDNDKTSFIISIENKPGSLYHIIETFWKNNVNMIKIESRPEKKEMGKYIFFIDIDANIENPGVKKSWEEINNIASRCKILGSYRKG